MSKRGMPTTTTIRNLRQMRRKILKDERSHATRYLTRRRTFNRMLRALRAGGHEDERRQGLHNCEGYDMDTDCKDEDDIYTCDATGCTEVRMIFGRLVRIFTFKDGLQVVNEQLVDTYGEQITTPVVTYNKSTYQMEKDVHGKDIEAVSYTHLTLPTKA